MKKIFVLISVFISVHAMGQMQPEYEVGYYRPFTLVPSYTFIAQSYIWIKGGFDSVFHVPAGTTATLRTGGWKRTGAIFYDSTGVDSGFYVYGSGGVWQRLARAAEIATPYTVSNGLTLASSNIKLGGTLVNNTVINSRGFSFRIDSSTLQNFMTYRSADTSTAYLSLPSSVGQRVKIAYEDPANGLGGGSAGLQVEPLGDGMDVVLFAQNGTVTPFPVLRGRSELKDILITALEFSMPNLANDATQNRLVGLNLNGENPLGFVTIGSGLSLSGGDLSATGGGYTNLTQFVAQTAWRGFYSDGSGDVQEQAFGTSGKVWTSNGTTAAPTWETPSSGGTPAGNFGNIQINRNGAFATPGSDSLDFESATGLTAKGNITALIGQFQQGGVAGITNGYLRTNSTNLASTTDLNPGVALYGGGAGVAVYGFDLGYNATSARYRNRMFMFGTSADIAFSATNDTPPTAQSGFTDLVVIRGDSGNMGIGVIAPTGVLHLKAGTVAANTAPIKFTSGTILGTIEAGAKEYNNAHYETTAALNRLATGGAIKDFLITADNSGTGETDLFTYTTKASTLAVDGEKLIFNIGGTFNDLTATAQLQFYFGGTSIGNTGALTVSAIGGWSANIFVIRTSSTTVRTLVAVTTPGASTAVYTTQTDLTGLTLSGTNIIKVTGTAAGASGGSGDISAKLGTIFWYGAVSN